MQDKILWNSDCVSSINAYAHLPLKYNQQQQFWKRQISIHYFNPCFKRPFVKHPPWDLFHVYQKNPFLVSTIPSGPAQTCHCFCPAHGRWNSIQNPCRTYCAVPQRLNPPYSWRHLKTGVMLVSTRTPHYWVQIMQITVSQGWHAFMVWCSQGQQFIRQSPTVGQ